jgi:RNA polymerase sigma-70 factor (ECF subfamily)
MIPTEVSSSIPPDDTALISAAQRGDLTAYRKLYDIHVGMVYGLATRLVKDRSAAEDVAQEVFIKVWKDIGQFRNESKFSTWLHRICTFTSISYLRRQRSWLKRVITGDDAIPEVAAEPQGHVDLESYVNRLPERARLVFVLHAIEGYRHEDIASMCDMAVGSSKAQFHRARQLLEEWMHHE